MSRGKISGRCLSSTSILLVVMTFCSSVGIRRPIDFILHGLGVMLRSGSPVRICSSCARYHAADSHNGESTQRVVGEYVQKLSSCACGALVFAQNFSDIESCLTQCANAASNTLAATTLFRGCLVLQTFKDSFWLASEMRYRRHTRLNDVLYEFTDMNR